MHLCQTNFEWEKGKCKYIDAAPDNVLCIVSPGLYLSIYFSFTQSKCAFQALDITTPVQLPLFSKACIQLGRQLGIPVWKESEWFSLGVYTVWHYYYKEIVNITSNQNVAWLSSAGFPNLGVRETLKEYYEIVDEARPLSGFFPTHADFVTEMHF